MNKEIQWLLKEKYHGEKTEGFLADCERLAAGEPLGYVIGFVPFLGCRIQLDSHPLIPRPETEYWTEQAIKAIKTILASHNDTAELRVLDLCTGSGAIGVAVAHAVPQAHVTWTEIDPTHLPTIEKNLAENTTIHGSNTYQILQSDLFATFKHSDVPPIFDFILTNPPYIDAAADTVETSVTAHEPHLALFGGMQGMEVIARIINDAVDYLTLGGQLWIEHEPFQADTIKEIALGAGYFVAHHTDQYGTVRYSVLTLNVAK